MKKERKIQKMKNRKYRFMLIMSFLLIVGFQTQSIKALADTDESMEAEKYYMQSENREGEKSPINVVISDEKEQVTNNNVSSDNYSFEKSLADTNTYDLFEKNSAKITKELDNSNERTVTINRGEYELIEQFTKSYLNTYLAKEMPDLDMYYDLSNKVREENRILNEAFIYSEAIMKSNVVESVESTVHITKVTPISENVDEIIFYLEKTLHTNTGDENSGTWFVANVCPTEDGYKFLNIWIQNFEFEMMQNDFKDDYLRRDVFLKREDIREEILRIKESGQMATLVEDSDEPSDKVGDNDIFTVRKSTLPYDRETVVKRAKKYAKSYNTLFVKYNGLGGDCTNFVSQSMWQCPDWKFDTIGKDNSVKWACSKKNGSKKYSYDTISWVGVNELWTYFQTNDSPSQAGTVYGISATTSGYNSSNVQLGDIIQFNNGDIWRHSVIVSEITDGVVYCAAHSDDQERKSLNEYMSKYKKYRVAHINNFITSY